MSEYDFDAIVVGSGMSGGWAAKELAEKGLKTLVIERGRHIEHGEDYIHENSDIWDLPHNDKVPKDELAEHWPIQGKCYALRESTKHFFTKDSEHTYIQDKPFDWIRGFNLGGKSLLWHRHSYRLNEIDFEANKKDGHGTDWPIRYKDLAPWYDYVETFAGISGNKDGLDVLPDGKFQPPIEMNVVEKHVKKVIESKYSDRNMIMGRTAHLTEPTQEQIDLGRGACQSRNQCQRGCSYGAYFSSLSATLPAARRTGNLTEITNTVVHSVVYNPKTKKASGVRVVDAKTKEHRIIKARIVFVCASTIASAQILMNSKSDTYQNGIGNTSGVLGRYLMDHISQVGASGEMPGFEDSYYQGRRPTSAIIPRFRNYGDDKQDYLRGYIYQIRARRDSWSQTSKKAGIGADYKNSIRTPGKWTLNMGGMGEMLPHYDNHVSLDASRTDEFGVPILHTSCEFKENELKMREDIADTAVDMLTEIGAKNIRRRLNQTAPGIDIHEMGTARMGRDPKTSYLNGFNQNHEVANLFVTDGAAFPSTSCVNPSLTFMALTARAADYAVTQIKTGKL